MIQFVNAIQAKIQPATFSSTCAAPSSEYRAMSSESKVLVLAVRPKAAD